MRGRGEEGVMGSGRASRARRRLRGCGPGLGGCTGDGGGTNHRDRSRSELGEIQIAVVDEEPKATAKAAGRFRNILADLEPLG
jgi:hypothetical protein